VIAAFDPSLMNGIPWGMIVALLAGGLVTGFLAGLLGVGGGAILVPVLYEIFSYAGVDTAVRMHMTLGTALAVIVPTALRSFSGHYAKGAVDISVLKRLGPWVALGVVAGVGLAKVSTSDALKWVWVIAGSMLALKMALGRDDWKLADTLPSHPAIALVSVIIGMLSALMSIGGGMFIVSLLTLYGKPILQAVATSSGFGVIISIPGAIGYGLAGVGIEGRPPYSLIPASVFAAPFGVRVAHAIPKRKLELAFAVFLTAVALRFLWSLAG
jgi:uncharacterized protein